MILDVIMAAAKPMAVICGTNRAAQVTLIAFCLLISLGVAFGKPFVKMLKRINKKYNIVSFGNDFYSFVDDDED